MKMKKKIRIIALTILLLAQQGFAQEREKNKERMDKMWGESSSENDLLKTGRGKLFDESNFAMFIHWGLFSHLGGIWNNTTYYGIGEWKHVHQISQWEEKSSAVWTVDVFKSGYYYLDLRYRGKGKLVWRTVTDEGIVVQNQQAATEKYQNYSMGIVEFKKSGIHTIMVTLIEGDRQSSSLESAWIRPVD